MYMCRWVCNTLPQLQQVLETAWNWCKNTCCSGTALWFCTTSIKCTNLHSQSFCTQLLESFKRSTCRIFAVRSEMYRIMYWGLELVSYNLNRCLLCLASRVLLPCPKKTRSKGNVRRWLAKEWYAERRPWAAGRILKLRTLGCYAAILLYKILASIERSRSSFCSHYRDWRTVETWRAS